MTHGTRSAYVKGCKCGPCRAANSRYSKLQEYRAIAGIRTLVDAGPSKEHVAKLRAAGVGRRTIAARSGVSQTVVDRLVGLNTDRACNRVRPETERRILAVRADGLADGSGIDATGTVRRLRALVALGWTETELARRIGWTVANLNLLIVARRPQVLVRTARLVEGLYDELSMTPGPSGRARNLAASRGWLPPLAWDDEQIDDPDHQPENVRRLPAKHSGITMEDIAEARAQGYETADQIGWRLGITRHAVAQILSRAGQVAS